MSMLERLARILAAQYHQSAYCGQEGEKEYVDETWEAFLGDVDAILRELPMCLTLEFLGRVRARFVLGSYAAPNEADISLIVKAAIAEILDEADTKDDAA